MGFRNLQEKLENRGYTAKCLGRLIRFLRLLKTIRFKPNLFGFLYRDQITDRFVLKVGD